MPHGAPDWWTYRTTSKSYNLKDMAELAARLGSIHTFDRRGDVIWFETFTHGLQRWSLNIGGAGASVVISPVSFLSDGVSTLVTCRSNGNFTNGIQNWLPFTPHGDVGVEAAFTLDSQHTAFVLTLYTYDGADRTVAAIRYAPGTDTLDYLVDPTAPGTWTSLAPTQVITPANRLFSHMKLVTDPANNLYVRAILNHVEYPLTNIPVFTAADVITTARLYVDLSYVGANLLNPTGYIDNVIVTEDEP